MYIRVSGNVRTVDGGGYPLVWGGGGGHKPPVVNLYPEQLIFLEGLSIVVLCYVLIPYTTTALSVNQERWESRYSLFPTSAEYIPLVTRHTLILSSKRMLERQEERQRGKCRDKEAGGEAKRKVDKQRGKW
ncbi:hypothetical protein LSTR_LSTR005368 [Laodelphax striatellus]|uniref:Uncharacterized protein n=1 Tax=Laodelphax striatellus TaxID=195883 RepID=A0A482WQT0_LAOST|nr:hypothetical protein LSTR_LSTR005368 [Laodelphax striatellus]